MIQQVRPGLEQKSRGLYTLWINASKKKRADTSIRSYSFYCFIP